MSTLENAPLIEVIVELRWGTVVRHENDSTIEIQFTSEERSFFPGQFKTLAAQKGFTCYEPVNPAEIPIPHFVKHRFRPVANQWPCYQIGDGLFTANQTKEGYEWETFKQTTIDGLRILDGSHPQKLSELPLLGIELRYQDGFILEDNETPLDFLNNKFNLNFSFPEQFTKPELIEDNIRVNSFSVVLNSLVPPGNIIIDIKEALINGKPSIIMETTVRSSDQNAPSKNIDTFSDWLEKAHDLQRHFFKTLISHKYAETFK